MTATPSPSSSELDQATEAIRREYDHRDQRARAPFRSPMFQSRLDHWERLFRTLALLPLAPRRMLDMGCRNGEWLFLCCQRWGAREEDCVGVDLRDNEFAPWRQRRPTSRITLLCEPADRLGLPDASFDLVHQSMMLSSVPNARLREEIAGTMWRLTRPGGFVVSYDFWINPFNPHTIGIRRRELRRLFPQARCMFSRTITLAPPLCRLLAPLGSGLLLQLEKLRCLNTHYLVALAKPLA